MTTIEPTLSHIPIIILDINTKLGNQILVSDSIHINKGDLFYKNSVGVLVEKVVLIEDFFESFWLLDVYVISNKAGGGTSIVYPLLKIGDELKLLKPSYEKTSNK